MSSGLPTENAIDKAVKSWGIDTYDGQRDDSGDHGEDSEGHEPAGRSLPDDATKSPQTNSPEEWLSYPDEPESRTVTNLVSSVKPKRKGPLPNGVVPPEEDIDEGSLEVFNPDRNLSYPDSADARLGTVWYRGFTSHSGVPGDVDGNFQHFHPKTENYDAVVETSAGSGKSVLPQEQGVDGRDPGAMSKSQKKTSDKHAELPTESDNPAARSDYYDNMHPGHTGSARHALFSDYVAPTEDSGAYAGQDKTSDSALPVPMKNEQSMDDWLQSLGNWWSGQEIEDVSSPQGFPTTDFDENINYDRSDNQDGGTTVPLGDPKMFASGGTSMQTRQATNINQVVSLTKEFLKEAGEKGLTKRHVLAFLQSRQLPQYLSSDIIRCLKISHDIHVKDVLDEFPAARKASLTVMPDGRMAEVVAKISAESVESLASQLESALSGKKDFHDLAIEAHITRVKGAQKTSVARARQAIIDLECKHVLQPEVAGVLRRCAAGLTRVLIDMERLASDDMKEAEKCYEEHSNDALKTAYDAYVESCKMSGQPPMSHDEWVRGYENQAVTPPGTY